LEVVMEVFSLAADPLTATPLRDLARGETEEF
jgi:hypothetical protein